MSDVLTRQEREAMSDARRNLMVLCHTLTRKTGREHGFNVYRVSATGWWVAYLSGADEKGIFLRILAVESATAEGAVMGLRRASAGLYGEKTSGGVDDVAG